MWFPLALLLSVPVFVGAFGSTDASLGDVRILWIFIWVEVVWTALWIAKLFTKFVIAANDTLSSILRYDRKYVLMISALEIQISLVCWVFISWITFIPIMTGNPDQRRLNDRATKSWEKSLTRVLAAFLIGSILLLAERLMIQMISVTYHEKQYSLRIKGYKHKIKILAILLSISRSLFPLYCPEFIDLDMAVSSIATPKIEKKNVVKALNNIGKVRNNVAQVFGNVANEIAGGEVQSMDNSSSKAIVTYALERRETSKCLAKRIWMSLVPENKSFLSKDDIIEVASPFFEIGHDDSRDAHTEEFADACMFALDGDGNGDISLDEMINVFGEIAREKKSVLKSVTDVDSAIGVLNSVLTVVVAIITIFVLVAFLNQNFTTVLATAGTTLISLSFIFSVTCQEVLASCIFLFVKHPFDIADRVVIADVTYIVDHISLLHSVFHHVGNQRSVQVPNSVLNSLFIENVTRSNSLSETVTVPVNIITTSEDLESLRVQIETFVHQNARDYRSDVFVGFTGISAVDRITMLVKVHYKSNAFSDVTRLQRRNELLTAISTAIQKVPIYPPGVDGTPGLGTVDQPTYTVSVGDDIAQSRFDKFIKERDSARFRAHT
ncbi:Mechanosensitive ion channel-domain-containing protein [Dipodascopsis uninucleata]